MHLYRLLSTQETFEELAAHAQSTNLWEISPARYLLRYFDRIWAAEKTGDYYRRRSIFVQDTSQSWYFEMCKRNGFVHRKSHLDIFIIGDSPEILSCSHEIAVAGQTWCLARYRAFMTRVDTNRFISKF